MTDFVEQGERIGPKILVFSSTSISDPGIDLAGSAHMSYPSSVVTIAVPCSSGIKPGWILHALEAGFDGVFIAADGSDCSYVPDCTSRTADVVSRTQELLEQHGVDPGRLKMAAICSVCAEAFVTHMEKFHKALGELAKS